MNKDRRRSISDIVSVLNDEIDIKTTVEACVGSQIPGTPDAPGESIETLGYEKLIEDLEVMAQKLDALAGEIEGIRDEEQDYFDNMPESFKEGEKGSRAEEAVSNLESAKESVDEAAEAIRDQISALKTSPRPDLGSVRDWAEGDSIRDALNDATYSLEAASE